MQLCAAGTGPLCDHRRPGTAAAEPDPAGAGDAVLSGCAADGDRERPSGIFVRRGSRDALCSAASGSAAGCPHRGPGRPPAGPVFAAGRGADAVQRIRGGSGLPFSGRGRPGSDERGRSLPDRCVPQSAGPAAEDLGGGVGARKRPRPGSGHRCVSGGGAEGPAEVAPPEKTLPPPAGWPPAQAGRGVRRAGRAERDAGTLRGQTEQEPRGAASLPSTESGPGTVGAERDPLQPRRCVPADQPQLPCGKGQRVYSACFLTKSIAKVPARWLPLAADAGRLRHGRHPGR